VSRPLLAALLLLAFARPAEATFSIAAYDSVTRSWASPSSRVRSASDGGPVAEAGVGAIATQLDERVLRAARPRPAPPGRGRALGASRAARGRLRLGAPAAGDRRRARARRELHRKLCSPWAGGVTGPGYAIQGNILAGEPVVKEMERAFLAPGASWPSGSSPRSSRTVGGRGPARHAVGGDSSWSGRARSTRIPTRYVDLRVEDHRDPIAELVRVYRILEGQDLAEAHLRYAAAYEKSGRADLARLERERVGESLARALQRPDNDASTLNGLAWVCARTTCISRTRSGPPSGRRAGTEERRDPRHARGGPLPDGPPRPRRRDREAGARAFARRPVSQGQLARFQAGKP